MRWMKNEPHRPLTTPRTSHAPLAAVPVAHPLEAVPGLTGVPRTKVFEDVHNGKLRVRKRGRTSIVEHSGTSNHCRSSRRSSGNRQRKSSATAPEEHEVLAA
jgi:hypothetical protein